MAGLYIHIPFCRKACIYCDFHFSTQLGGKSAMVDALCREISLRHDYLGRDRVDTLYFGGGTPSVLTQEELSRIIRTVGDNFNLAPEAEITLEANPDDLHSEKLNELAASPINRLSIGLQSFDEEDLRWMNRSHNADQAEACVHEARQAGFENITIDLIYGIPGRSLSHWQRQLKRAMDLKVPHISAYALTVENETVLENWIRKGRVKPLDEREAQKQFNAVATFLQQQGYEHYEVSNFARPGHRAIHNTSYWQDEPYLGIGPSAHSYDGESRQWNVANNQLYQSAVAEDEVPYEKENLSVAERYNEVVMTSLRRIEGIDLAVIDEKFGAEFSNHLVQEAAPLKLQGKLVQHGARLYIPTPQRFFSDGVAAGLFYV